MSLTKLDHRFVSGSHRRCPDQGSVKETGQSERALFTKRRKDAYEALHPETKAGSSQAAGMNKSLGRGDVADNLAATFVSETARSTGKDERTIRRDAERGEKISAEAIASCQPR